MPSRLNLDYEAFAEVPLSGQKSVGSWLYTGDIATEATMVAYRLDQQEPRQVDLTDEAMPGELVEALLDPEVEKWAFNSPFERLTTKRTLGIDTPTKGWRCTMALANLQSFTGDLGTIGRAMGLPDDKVKDKEGQRLINLFCMPQPLTRKNSLYRRDKYSDPDDWQRFLDYNAQDEVAEHEIYKRLIKFPIPPEEWELFEIDQQINDTGMPVNRAFVVHAQMLSDRRKRELTGFLSDLTGLRNPNSGSQFLEWVRERGYFFNDLQKDTVKKVLAADKAARVAGLDALLTDDCVAGLKLRQQASRTSVKKYPAILQRLDHSNNLRHCFQFAGAARTARWAGRGPQPHNLTRTPKVLEAEDGLADKLEVTAKVIESGDYDDLALLFDEPMVALAGSIRSSFQAHEGEELKVCDLSAIESAVTAWVTNCARLLGVFRDGRDPYRDFGVELYKIPYAEITSAQRTICKPAVLGCAYRLGGGNLFEGKRTGLWGYAENMGVDITEEEALRQVTLFRTIYSEIPEMWTALEDAARDALAGKTVYVGHNGMLMFKMNGPYLTIRLPSGRYLYYYRPKFVKKTFTGKKGPYTRSVFSYMGMNQKTRQWCRVSSNGGKILENVVQAIARDVLREGIVAAHKAGFKIVGHVHDEIITMVKKGSNSLPFELLRECMMKPLSWAPGLPLGAAGYTSTIYRKD